MKDLPNKVKISIVASIAGPRRVLGNKGALAVHISDDLKRFKALTTGHPIIMGRKTFESIGKALPGRTNYVVTRNPDFKAEGIVVCSNLDEAIEKASVLEMASANENKEVFVIGGGDIYAQALPRTDRLYLTLVENDPDGDVFFPDYSGFNRVELKEDRVDQKTGLRYSWIDLEK